MPQPTYPYPWSKSADGQWQHRPWWKVLINGVLRFFQPGPVKWVVYAECDETPNDSPTPPKVFGYGFGPVVHLTLPKQMQDRTRVPPPL